MRPDERDLDEEIRSHIILGAATVLGGAAILASLMPAVRAARVNVLQALRAE